MENKLVRYSRAGDVFHYRWAARRCLRMIYPNSNLSLITVESSKEIKEAGEYMIDLAEYYTTVDDSERVIYYQLKHTTVKKETPFLLSDLKDTIVGFSERFSANKSKKNTQFKVITNRPVEKILKDTIDLVTRDEKYNVGKFKTLKKYTKLNDEDLVTFCKQLEFIDKEGDFQEQKYELQREISEIISGTIDNTILDTIEALVKERALPNSDGVIKKEDILSRFGVSNERELYPAPTVFEKIDNIIFIKKHYDLAKNIITRREKTIVHASGGVGKSICYSNY